MAIELRNINPVIFDYNVGVGTEAPAYKLDVNGVARIGTTARYGDERLVLRGAGVASWMQNTNGGLVLGFLEPNNNQSGGIIAENYSGGFPFTIYANDYLKLSTNGNTERMRITVGGLVGIGTSNPEVKLDVLGYTKADKFGLNANGYYYFDNFGGSNFMGLNDGHLKFYVGGYARLVINSSSGNIGVGPDSPAAKLDLQGYANGSVQAILTRGADNSFQLRAVNATASNSDGALVSKFGLVYSGVGDAAVFKFYRGSGAQNASLAIDTGGSERLRIDASGNIGINVSPDASHKLLVNGRVRFYDKFTASSGFSSYTNDGLYGSTATPCEIDFPNGSQMLFGYYSPGNGYYFPRIGTLLQGSNSALSFGATPNQSNYSISDFSITLGGERLFSVTNEGKVGIGTPSPVEKLHVVGNIKVDGSLKFADGSSYPSALSTSVRAMACPIDGARGVYDNDVLWMWDGRLTNPNTPIYTTGTNGAYTQGSTAYTASSRISFVGSAYKSYTGYENGSWNNQCMTEFTSFSRVWGNPTSYMLFTLPCDQNFHNVFHLKAINGDRHTSFMTYIADSNGTIQKKLQGRSCAPSSNWSYTCDVGPRNTMARTEPFFAWHSFTIPKTFLQSYSFADGTSPTGRSVKIAFNLGPEGDPQLYLAGLAISRNPTGFCFADSLDMHWGSNGGSNRFNGIYYDSNNWAEAAYGRIAAGSNISDVRFPIAGIDRDILFAFIEYNQTWMGTPPLLLLHDFYDGFDRPNAIFRLSHFNIGTYGMAYGGARLHQKSMGFIIPKELVAAVHRTDHYGALQLRFRIWSGGAHNHFHYRGAYTEQVNRIGNDKTFPNNAMNMKNNNFKSYDMANLGTNDSV